MNSPTGQIPPLHRRFDETKALRYIRKRYVGLKRDIFRQVEALQQDIGVRKKFCEYYQQGYPDWVILSAVFNCMINWKANEAGLSIRFPGSAEEARRETKAIGDLRGCLKDAIYPSGWFRTSDMDLHMRGNAIIVLKTYGFECRRSDLRPEIVEKFLRERMKHYEFDFPHQPLFGEPPGNWPNIR